MYALRTFYFYFGRNAWPQAMLNILFVTLVFDKVKTSHINRSVRERA